MTARVLVGILNFNTIDDCVSTVESYRAQTYADCDVIVVDNASSNDAAEQVAARCSGLTVECNPRNDGFAAGINSILRRAAERGYEYALCSNSDVAVDADAVARLVATAKRHPSAALIGVVEVGWESGAVRAAGGTGFSFVRGRERWITTVPSEPTFVDYPQGVCFLVAVDSVRDGFALDDSLFLYYEEVDIGFRLQRMGRRAIVDPSVRVRHRADTRHLVVRNAYYQQRNRLYLVRRYGTAAQFALHVCYQALVELPVKVVVRSLQGHGRFARACVLGFLDGLRGRMGGRA